MSHLLLKKYFGYDTFRPLQAEIIASVLAQNDNLVLMPTGGGKSLCFQIPALEFSGLTLVISPLIALMKDQVDSLNANGIPAAFLNSSLTSLEQTQIKKAAQNKKIKLLYIAPERFQNTAFLSFLKTLPLSLIAIDEAHCISEWGHDFRPDYRNLKILRQNFPQTPLIALTASATKKVQQDIISELNLYNPRVFQSSFYRPNLTLKIFPKQESNTSILQLLTKHQNVPVIIYCFSRRETENLANLLQTNGIKALAYHAGLPRAERTQVQEKFGRDEISVITATIAFGMGIDKPDVRLIIHTTFPKTLEGYYQEIGRAGRDSLPSDCVLFYSYGDLRKHEFFLNQLPDPTVQAKERQHLEKILQFCQNRGCRWKALTEHFGENFAPGKCQTCDQCLAAQDTFDATEVTQKILSAVIRTENFFGKKYIVEILRGAKTQKILTHQHEQLSVYGIEKKIASRELLEIFQMLIDQGFLLLNSGEYPTYRISPKGLTFLKERKTLTLPKVQSVHSLSAQPTEEFDPALFPKLKALRKHLADEQNVPPFVIFGDQSLQEMAYYLPNSREEFAKISGVGKLKLQQFAEPFLAVIQQYCASKNLKAKLIPAFPKKISSQKSLTERQQVTKDLVQKRYPLAKIAATQGVKPDTIITYLERLIETGVELDLEYLQPEPQIFTQIQTAFAHCGLEFLKPVFDFLEEKIPYETLKLVRLYLKNKQRQKKSVQTSP